MNILENKTFSYPLRYKKAITQLLFKPHQFYNQPLQKKYTTSIKFYLSSHYFYLLFSLPFLSVFLEKARFFLRLSGHLKLASSNLLNTPVFLFINLLIIPPVILMFILVMSHFYQLVLIKYKAETGHIFSSLTSAYCAALLPASIFLSFFFLADWFIYSHFVIISIGFWGTPILFVIIVYYLVRRAFRIRYKITRGIIILYLILPLFIFFFIIVIIYLSSVL